MVVSIEYLLFLIVKVYFLLLYGVMDAKGETVGRLIRSFINYILIAITVFLTLNFLGVDTATLLASMGLLSLAISLGAKDIVADILSGCPESASYSTVHIMWVIRSRQGASRVK